MRKLKGRSAHRKKIARAIQPFGDNDRSVLVAGENEKAPLVRARLLKSDSFENSSYIGRNRSTNRQAVKKFFHLNKSDP